MSTETLLPNIDDEDFSIIIILEILGIVTVFLLCLLILRYVCNNICIDIVVLRNFESFKKCSRLFCFCSRHGQGDSQQQQEQQQQQQEQEADLLQGLTMNEKQQLFSSILTIKVAADDDDLKQQCSICISEIEMQNQIAITACNHIFHQSCLYQWLISTRKNCPYCRTEIINKQMLEGRFRIRNTTTSTP